MLSTQASPYTRKQVSQCMAACKPVSHSQCVSVSGGGGAAGECVCGVCGRVWEVVCVVLVGACLCVGVGATRRACGVAQVESIAFCPSDPTILASGGGDKKVTLWEWRSGKQHGQPLQHSGAVRV